MSVVAASFGLLADKALSGLAQKNLLYTPSHCSSSLSFCDVSNCQLVHCRSFFGIVSTCNSLQTNSEFSVLSISLIASGLGKSLLSPSNFLQSAQVAKNHGKRFFHLLFLIRIVA